MLGAPRRSDSVGPLLPALAGLALLFAACAPPSLEPVRPPSASPERANEATTRGRASAPVLTFSHSAAKGTPRGRAAEKFADLVKSRSGGKLEVIVFHDAELYKDTDELEALQRGTIHFIAPGTDQFGALVPRWEATALPHLFTDDVAVEAFLDPDNRVTRELLESPRPRGLLGLAIWADGFKHFTTSKRPLKAPSDFGGLKIRASGKPDEAFVRALGGGAMVMSSAEVFGALQQGVVDGQYSTWSNVRSHKLDEVQKYATLGRGGAYQAYAVATNARWWDGLEAETRRLLGEALKEATAFEKPLAERANAEALAELKRSGRLEFYAQTADDAAAFERAAEKVIAAWQARTGRELIAKLRTMN